MIAFILLELIVYPVSYSRLDDGDNVKTKGSVILLTDDTPGELRIYHRAFILPRYRLNKALSLDRAKDGEAFMTANDDWFQTFVVSVEDGEIVLYSPKNSVRAVLWLTLLLSLTGLFNATFSYAAKRRQI